MLNVDLKDTVSCIWFTSFRIQKLKAQLQIFHKEQLQNQKHNLQKSKMVYTRHRDN